MIMVDSILYDSIGDPFDTISIVTFDTTQINTYTQENITGQNTYSKLSIPLSFGYRFTHKSWMFIPQVGLNIEFELNRNNRSYPNTFLSEMESVPPRRVSMSYMIQFEVRKEFSNWFVYASPFYRNSITNVVESTNMNRKYGSIGSVFGLGVKF
jgi:hypothetical protein